MPAFATPGPIAATVEVAGAQVQVSANDRTDTVVLGISEGTAADIDASSERGTVRNSLPPEDPATSGNRVALHARTRHGDIIIQRAAS